MTSELDSAIEQIGSETIACRITATTPAGIATVSIVGRRASEVVLTLAKLRTDQLSIGRIHYGEWPVVFPDSTLQDLDIQDTFQPTTTTRAVAYEQVVVCRVSAQEVEVHCHGGIAVTRAILESLSNASIRECSQSAWSQLKYSDQTGQIKLLEDLTSARTDKVAAVILDQLHGAMQRFWLALREILGAPEPDLLRARQVLEGVSQWSVFGTHLVDGWSVVLAGPPNVGKSSLVNALAGQQTVIVHSEPGTTRDWVEANVVLNGWPIQLTDTAGLRETSEQIEAEGIQRSYERIESADLIVLVVDHTVGWTNIHGELLEQIRTDGTPFVVCLHKSDLEQGQGRGLDSLEQMTVCRTSVQTRDGVEPLRTSIEQSLFAVEPSAGAAVPIAETDRELIRELLADLDERPSKSLLDRIQGHLRP